MSQSKIHFHNFGVRKSQYFHNFSRLYTSVTVGGMFSVLYLKVSLDLSMGCFHNFSVGRVLEPGSHSKGSLYFLFDIIMSVCT